jgi:hypothetical protein
MLGWMMSGTSSKDSRTPLKLLSEALRERLSPEEWSAIFGDEYEPASTRSPKERTK